MIDSLEMMRPAIESANTLEKLAVKRHSYALVTLHRPSNVDDKSALHSITEAFADVSAQLPLLIVLHPRTKHRLQEFGLTGMLSLPNIVLLEPLPYIEFMSLVMGAKAVITDSGGLQEETTYLGIPCLTMRDNTERPITIELGTNRLVTANDLRAELQKIIDNQWPAGSRPPLWDGRTAERAVARLRERSGLR